MAILKRPARRSAVGASPGADVPAGPSAGAPAAPTTTRRERGRLALGALGPVLLLRAAHPRQAALTAAALAVAAALTGRSGREVGLVLVTVLVGQAILGWHNDLTDRPRDRSHERTGKPLARDLLDPGAVWFSLACAVLLLVPLAIANGVTAGLSYLLAVLIGALGNVVLRGGWLSWLPWAASFALFPAFLSYGGWAGDATGRPPEVSVTVLAALLGVGVHVLRALPGLVADHEDGLRHLPLRLALHLGAGRVLLLASVGTGLVAVVLLLVGHAVGLSQ